MVITLKQEEIVENSEILYIVIGIFAIVIILLVLTLCTVMYKKRNVSNMKLMEAAKDKSNKREKMKDYEAANCDDEDDDDECCLGKQEERMTRPEPDLIPPFKKANQLPRQLLSDDEDEPDDIPRFVLTPLEDEPQTFHKSNKPFMIQRFEKQPLPSNPSFSSMNSSHISTSIDSEISNVETPFSSMARQTTYECEKPFLIKNVHVSGRNQMFPKPTENTKANMQYTLEDDSDDQYVTLLPSPHSTA